MSKSNKARSRRLWILVISLALACPSLPLTYVLWNNIRDPRELARRQILETLPPITEDRKILLVTVPGWPSMATVVHEDEASGPTAVGFEFKAKTLAGDIGSALKSLGVEVVTRPVEELTDLEALPDYSSLVFIYPVRHQFLPWELTRFFNEIVEPRVATYQAGLNNVPVAAFALGDTAEDVDGATNAMAELTKRYDLNALTNTGVADSSDRLQLYQDTIDFAGELMSSLDQLAASRDDREKLD